MPQHRHRQSINQVGAGGGFTIWFTKLIPHFYTPSKLGGFRPASQHLLESYQSWDVIGRIVDFVGSLVFGRANKIEGRQSHHFGSPFIIIRARNALCSAFWYYWLSRIYGFWIRIILRGYERKLGSNRRQWRFVVMEKSPLCCEPSDKLGRHKLYGFTKTRFEPWEVAILRLHATTEEAQMKWRQGSLKMLKTFFLQQQQIVLP